MRMRKRSFGVLILTLAMVLPALAQYGGHRRRLSPSDQQRFDSYYSRWINYRRTNNRDQMISMQRRMDELKGRYNIGPEVPNERIASPGTR
jgi:thiaminase